MKTIKVGICGLGTVGAGTAQMLQKNAAIIQKRTGIDIHVTKAATIDPYEHLDIDFSQITVSRSVDDILNDPGIDVVVELIGGDGLAKQIILQAFENGKSVVTANKALLAKHASEIFNAAYRSKGGFGFEASVGGGIPIIRSVREGFAGDRIDGFSGIINGTANYILSAMSNEGRDFETALKKAQELGFAEADPTFDVEGIDTAHKVIILMSLAFNALFDFSDLYTEGMSHITADDIALAENLGYAIKLLGKAKATEKGYEGRVHPALVKSDSMLASVQGAFNAISVYGNFVGHTMSYGAGAGSHPTASAVVGDIIDIARRSEAEGVKQIPPLAVPLEALEQKRILPIDEIESSYYLCCELNDLEGQQSILERIEQQGIKVLKSATLPPHQHRDSSLLAALTDTVQERDIQMLVKDLNLLSCKGQATKLIRVDS